MERVQSGKFVHVVASVDLDEGVGKLLYVTPSNVTTAPDTAGARGAPAPGDEAAFSLKVEDAGGQPLAHFYPPIQLPSDQDDGPRKGLIDEDIPLVPGMSRLLLLHGDTVVSTFAAGEQAPPATRGLQMGAAPGDPQDKRGMELEGSTDPQPGVNYTVQVRPEGSTPWQTISVGQPTPKVAIDRNQFPGAERADVRVLRSTGFEQAVVAEETVDLSFKE